ncbi:LysR family transcriptional regulator [Pseudomonas ovata]|uniref:LysR family transcriptional regulator n=1 Tax=Pseudomonas ovata TaxID=1839709 RepID=UPI000D687DCA|nr:LysR family transcriptional regulator [Pseudomonas ovata]
MSLKALRSLVAIARHGNFVKAADSLSLTPSAISLQIKALEDELRVSLFDRTRRQVTLTEAGRLALAQAEIILAQYDDLAHQLYSGPGLSGRIRIGAIQTALAGRLPEALVWIKNHHPRLHISVVSGMSSELARRVQDGELDAAITTEPVRPFPPSLSVTPLYHDRFWAVAAPHLQGQSLVRLLSTQPFLRFDKRAWAGRVIEQELNRMGIRVTEAMELDSQEALSRMASRGLGVAVVPLSDDDLVTLECVTLLPFGEPQLIRRVVLLEHDKSSRQHLTGVLAKALSNP